MKIVNYGSLNIDHVYGIAEFPLPGETIDSIRYETYMGGKGLNQSIALARCGVSIHHAGAIGQDGVKLKELLDSNGINTDFIKISEETTGHALVQVNAHGENCIILHHGANKTIEEQDVDAVLNTFTKGDVLLLQNEISQLPYLLEIASKKQMKIVFNPAPFTEQIQQADLRVVDYMILNESEAKSLSQCDTIEKATSFLKQTYPKTNFIITLGEHGCYFFNQDKTIYQKPYLVPVADTTGAGDTFIGYFIGCMVLGKPLEECLDIATKAASIAITKSGSSNAIPSMSEVTSYMFP